MKHILASLFVLLVSPFSFGAADYLSPDGMTQVMDGVDDGTYQVNLGHTFPYYGKVFSNAWMSTNGVILLYEPDTGAGNPNTRNSMCCSGYDLQNWQNGAGQWSYMIAPLWTDLIDKTQGADSGYFYETGEGGSSFLWYNVNEYYNDNSNTFQANLWPDGSFDFIYDEVDITQHSVFVGYTGDMTNTQDLGQIYYAQNSLTEFDLKEIASQDMGGAIAWYGKDGGYQSTAPTGPDCSDPKNDPSCEGYQEALLLQDAAGTDFVYGDDITDFYEEPEVWMPDTTQNFFEEETVYEFDEPDYGLPEVEEFAETFDDNYGAVPEEFDEVYTEPFDEQVEDIYTEPLVEETFTTEELVSEEIPVEEIFEESFETEITHEEIDMSKNQEEFDINEESVDSVYTTEELVQQNVNVLSIVSQQLSRDTQFSQTTQANSIFLSDTSTIETTKKEETDMLLSDKSETILAITGDKATYSVHFGSVDSEIEDTQINILVDPTVTTNTIEESQDESSIIIESDSGNLGMDSGFAAQQDQSFSTGQSITAVLNNVQPNFSQFDVAPPSSQERQTTQKAETQAQNMSQEQIEQNLENFTDDLQDSGGFTDQSVTIFLMGRVNGFDQYSGQLQDVSFYESKNLYTGNRVQNDRSSMLMLIGVDDKHERMVMEQYE